MLGADNSRARATRAQGPAAKAAASTTGVAVSSRQVATLTDVKSKNQQLAHVNTVLAIRVRERDAEIDRLRSENLLMRERILRRAPSLCDGCRNRGKRNGREQQRADIARVSVLAQSTEQIFTSLVAHLRGMADNFEENVLTAWRETQTSITVIDDPLSADGSLRSDNNVDVNDNNSDLDLDLGPPITSAVVNVSQRVYQNRQKFQNKIKQAATMEDLRETSQDVHEKDIESLCSQFDTCMPGA